MACGLLYNDVVVVTTLKENKDKTALVLDLPFNIYGQNIVWYGQDITYNLDMDIHKNEEVMAKVDYLITDNPDLAKKLTDPKKHAKYAEHYAHKKKDAWATYDEEDNKTEYNGADKEDYVAFCGSICMEE